MCSVLSAVRSAPRSPPHPPLKGGKECQGPGNIAPLMVVLQPRRCCYNYCFRMQVRPRTVVWCVLYLQPVVPVRSAARTCIANLAVMFLWSEPSDTLAGAWRQNEPPLAFLPSCILQCAGPWLGPNGNPGRAFPYRYVQRRSHVSLVTTETKPVQIGFDFLLYGPSSS